MSKARLIQKGIEALHAQAAARKAQRQAAEEAARKRKALEKERSDRAKERKIKAKEREARSLAHNERLKASRAKREREEIEARQREDADRVLPPRPKKSRKRVSEMDPIELQAHKAWYGVRRDIIKARQRDNWADPVKSKALRDQQKDYRDRNKERIKQRDKEWRDSRSEEQIEADRARSAAQASRRRAASGEQTPAHYNQEAVVDIYSRARDLSSSTGIDYEVDHVIPLLGERVSGLNVQDNLLIVPADLNRSKGNRFNPGDDPMKLNDTAQEALSQQSHDALLGNLLEGAHVNPKTDYWKRYTMLSNLLGITSK